MLKNIKLQSWIAIFTRYISSLILNKMLHCFNCYSSKKHIIFGAIHHRNSPLIIMLPCHVFIFVTMYNYNDKLLIVCTVWTRMENITELLQGNKIQIKLLCKGCVKILLKDYLEICHQCRLHTSITFSNSASSLSTDQLYQFDNNVIRT